MIQYKKLNVVYVSQSLVKNVVDADEYIIVLKVVKRNIIRNTNLIVRN